jgi:hypothetical protein
MGVECFPEKGMIRIFLKMNYNDFIYDYRSTVNDDQGFDPSGKIDTTIVLVHKYLTDRIQISADDLKLKGQFTNIEWANGELNMDLLYHYHKKAKRIKVKSTILNDLNKNPSTLLIFKANDLEEGVTLTPEKPEKTFLVK